MVNNLDLNNNTNIDINNNINNNINNDLSITQNNFLSNMFNKIIDISLDMGIRALLPDFLENEVINIKNNVLSKDFFSGFKNVINKFINLGKDVLGIDSNNQFNKIESIENVFNNNNFMSDIKNLLTESLNNLISDGDINEVYNKLNVNKNIILDNFKSNINNEFHFQNRTFFNLNKLIDNWKKSFEESNYNEMLNNYNQIEGLVDKVIPIENVIKDIRYIENIQELSMKKNDNFNISQEELNLAKQLI